MHRLFTAGLLCVVCIITASPNALHSQQVPPDLRQILILAKERRWRIRAVDTTRDTIEGRVGIVSNTDVTIDDHRYLLANLVKLERRSSELSFTSGTIAGVAIGGLSLLFLGPWFQGIGDAPCTSGCQLRWFAGGAAIGFVTSVAISPETSTWISVWSR